MCVKRLALVQKKNSKNSFLLVLKYSSLLFKQFKTVDFAACTVNWFY
ncbi:MAG: hypothetical protein RIQ33_2349 [Bacteroidota bacterium]|jgi:hypothetical protein